MSNTRLEIASRILAGFASNPAIFAPNGMSGWGLVNCNPEHLVDEALYYADLLIQKEQKRKQVAE